MKLLSIEFANNEQEWQFEKIVFFDLTLFEEKISKKSIKKKS